MAFPSSSSSTAAMAAPFGFPVSEKLNKSNLSLWKLQVLPAVRGAQLEGFLDGTNPAPPKDLDNKVNGKDVKRSNPEYARWVALDQQVLAYLLSTMTRDVMMQVAGARTSADLWAAVEEIFSSQTRARAMNTRIALTTLKKGNLSATDYMNKMKALADEMTAAGKPLGDEEFTAHIINGLDEDYNPLVSAILTRIEPIAYNELLTQLISFEARLDLQRGGGNGSNHSSVNAASRGRGSCGRSRGPRGGRGPPNGGCGRGNSNQSNNANSVLESDTPRYAQQPLDLERILRVRHKLTPYQERSR
ncbi:unnamed protein product [Urochloa humidicola]